MTSAPVKYDTAAGGAPANVLVGRPSTLEWEPVAGQPGRFVRRIGTGPRGDVWMGGAVEWSQRDGPWHHHAHDEECFVVEGAIVVTDVLAEETITSHADAGAYFYRPAGTVHGGPGSECAGTAVTFHRAFGPHETEWIDSEPGVSAD